MTLEFYDRFTGYLINDQKLAKNTLGMRIKSIKTILNEAQSVAYTLTWSLRSFRSIRPLGRVKLQRN